MKASLEFDLKSLKQVKHDYEQLRKAYDAMVNAAAANAAESHFSKTQEEANMQLIEGQGSCPTGGWDLKGSDSTLDGLD